MCDAGQLRAHRRLSGPGHDCGVLSSRQARGDRRAHRNVDFAEGALGESSPLRRSVLRLPAGLGIEVPHLRSCDLYRLQLLGARGCPAQSLLGVGRALVRAPLGSQSLGESISLWLFLGPLRNLQPTFAMLAQGYTPFDERVVLSGTVLPDNNLAYGEDLVLPVPRNPDAAARAGRAGRLDVPDDRLQPALSARIEHDHRANALPAWRLSVRGRTHLRRRVDAGHLHSHSLSTMNHKKAGTTDAK